MTIRLVISGCCGRMGQAIARRALADGAFSLAAVLEAPGHESMGRDYSAVVGQSVGAGLRVVVESRQALNQGDVLIEFTTPDATVAHVQLAQELKKPIVIGTTGLSDAQMETLRLASRAIPLVVSPNMSVGVNVLFELAQVAAKRLGRSYDVEVVESHHRHKKDSPSGTAKRLAELLAAARNGPSGSIPVHAIRAGDIVGDHTVVLAGPSERLELTHRAHSREAFAEGALRAAR
ncbi:MAG: 4-hydroxy-tetrahydrodipicolinate reductase, partial [Candidatus Omnitrophica bacterium]|nr:4-hydroxy-tetrahydrodipicolinate reductase [Candidatus Omnitrophota bacterium]